MPLRNVQVIRYSLGSHVAGFVVKKVYSVTGGKIWKITSLDVSGPFFLVFYHSRNQSIYKNDAVILENLHTDSSQYARGGVRNQVVAIL